MSSTMGFTELPTRGGAPARAAARARGEVYIVHKWEGQFSFGNQNEPVVVTDWISMLTWVQVYAFYHGLYKAPRARRRARVESSVLPQVWKRGGASERHDGLERPRWPKMVPTGPKRAQYDLQHVPIYSKNCSRRPSRYIQEASGSLLNGSE